MRRSGEHFVPTYFSIDQLKDKIFRTAGMGLATIALVACMNSDSTIDSQPISALPTPTPDIIHQRRDGLHLDRATPTPPLDHKHRDGMHIN